MDANRKTAYHTLLDMETKKAYSNLALSAVLEGEALTARSVLFVDGDGRLAQQADALFRDALRARAMEIRSGWCALEDATAALLDRYEAVLCMTMEQAEDLAARFPATDEKILCLGEKDILPDRPRTDRVLRREIEYLADELTMED